MKSPRGFTLIELLVAITIAGIVILLTHQIFAGVTDGIKRLELVQREVESEQLGIRWLSAAFLSIEAGNRGVGFEGARDRVKFSSWLMNENGWLERSEVTLWLKDRHLMARTDEGEVSVLEQVTGLAFDYLLDPGLNSRWVTEWVSPLTAPLAARVRLQRVDRSADTLLFLIKSRG